MELNEWTLSVLSLSVVKPSRKLLEYLGEHDGGKAGTRTLRDVIVPVLNRALTRIQQDDDSQAVLLLSIGRKDGQVYVNGGEITDDIQFAASVVGVYYHALEAMLQDNGRSADESFQFLHSDAFHRSLLACCYTCTLKAVGSYPKLRLGPNYQSCTVYSVLETVESSPYTYLKVAESFYRALVAQQQPKPDDGMGASPIIAGLPRVLQRHIKRTEVQIVDSVIWVHSSPLSPSEGTLAKTIRTLKNHPGCAWPPEALESVLPEEMEDLVMSPDARDVNSKPTLTATPETNFLSYVLRKLLKVAYFRIQALCRALSVPLDPVASQIFVAFRYLLRNAIELLYDRHVDQLILCTLYSICKVMNVATAPGEVITFGRIIDAYLAVRGQELGEQYCQLIVRHIKLVSSTNDAHPGNLPIIGNIIMFYNQLFVPKMKLHLLKSKSLKRTTEQLASMRLMMMNSFPPRMVPPMVQAQEGNSRVNVAVGQQGNGQLAGNGLSDSTPPYKVSGMTFSKMGDGSSKYANQKVKA
jgi:hypothetical protein